MFDDARIERDRLVAAALDPKCATLARASAALDQALEAAEFELKMLAAEVARQAHAAEHRKRAAAAEAERKKREAAEAEAKKIKRALEVEAEHKRLLERAKSLGISLSKE